MTLSSRHRIRNSSPGGLRPSTLPLGHGGSPQYWLSHVDGEETFFVSFKPPRPGTKTRTPAWKAAVLTTTLGPRPFLAKDELDERFSAQNVKLEHRRLTKSGIMITNHWMGWREFKKYDASSLCHVICSTQSVSCALRELRLDWCRWVWCCVIIKSHLGLQYPFFTISISIIFLQYWPSWALDRHYSSIWLTRCGVKSINECVRSYNNTKNAECQEHTWLYI